MTKDSDDDTLFELICGFLRIKNMEIIREKDPEIYKRELPSDYEIRWYFIMW